MLGSERTESAEGSGLVKVWTGMTVDSWCDCCGGWRALNIDAGGWWVATEALTGSETEGVTKFAAKDVAGSTSLSLAWTDWWSAVSISIKKYC